MSDLSREGPFNVLQDRPDSGASPLVLDCVRGCQYRMTSYDEASGGPDSTPVYGVQLHDHCVLDTHYYVTRSSHMCMGTPP